MDLAEAEVLRQGSKYTQNYTEKILTTQITRVCDHSPRARPPECKVKQALASKASGGAGIPAELFQTLKDDAVKVLHSICQQIWETQQWPQDWKKVNFHSNPKKAVQRMTGDSQVKLTAF